VIIEKILKDSTINLAICQREMIERAIDVLINPLENDINVALSRINKKIKTAVGDSFYDFYCIQGERGEKSISN
jgi:hypothetical protein